MKKLVIKKWYRYGQYLMFSNLVDEVGEWIMLQSTNENITAIGKEGSIKKYAELLDNRKIEYEIQ